MVKKAECRIVSILKPFQARRIVRDFRNGAGTRSLSRVYGLSRVGVEELIRFYGWKR